MARGQSVLLKQRYRGRAENCSACPSSAAPPPTFEGFAAISMRNSRISADFPLLLGPEGHQRASLRCRRCIFFALLFVLIDPYHGVIGHSEPLEEHRRVELSLCNWRRLLARQELRLKGHQRLLPSTPGRMLHICGVSPHRREDLRFLGEAAAGRAGPRSR